ncbi:DUF5103 domain-containing protein [Hymenobacter koreensis]|uniref:Type 9 secretion system plug protein N-terminal domain-containing protein n=1 Tax=Hymenobacter koreensis TaxID=1084523 RepID=A0ABP8J3T9_9BACT
MLRRSIRLFFLLCTAAACVPLGTPITDPNAGKPGQSSAVQAPQANRELRFEDAIYEEDVQSVQCYVRTGQPTEIFSPPVVALDQGQPIMLEFDILGNQGRRLTARLVHCNADWTPSVLTDLQFLNDINEFNLTDYRTSTGTQVPYYHYRLQVPPVKLSGNYLLVVQDQGRQPLISRRILVYENRVEVQAQLGLPPGGSARYTMQQVDFVIRYGAFPLVNPAVETKVVLRQNFRWDNAKYGLRPTFVRDAEQQLDYQYFNYENAFPALSEFRFADIRSLRTIGVGVAGINQQSSPREILLAPETSRASRAYTQYEDANGQRVFESRDFTGPGATNADYVWTTFQLAAESVAPGPVYVFGALSDWKLKPDFKLTYNAEKQLYTGRALLKQGYYNYYYVVGRSAPQPPDAAYFEGSYQLTENQYDLLVYYRPPGTRADLLIGYRTVVANGQEVQLRRGGLFR